MNTTKLTLFSFLTFTIFTALGTAAHAEDSTQAAVASDTQADDSRVFTNGEPVILYDGKNSFDGKVDAIYPNKDISFLYNADQKDYREQTLYLAKTSGCNDLNYCVNNDVIAYKIGDDGEFHAYKGKVAGIFANGDISFLSSYDNKKSFVAKDNVGRTTGCTLDQYCVTERVVVSDTSGENSFKGTISAILPNGQIIYTWDYNNDNYLADTSDVAKADAGVNTENMSAAVIADQVTQKVPLASTTTVATQEADQSAPAQAAQDAK